MRSSLISFGTRCEHKRMGGRIGRRGAESAIRLRVVLLIGHVFQPVDDLSILLLLDGDMRHGFIRHHAVPVLLARREPDYVPGRICSISPFALHEATAARHDQDVAQRVSVPRGASTGFERDAGHSRPGLLVRVEERIEPDISQYSSGPFSEGCEQPFLISICRPQSDMSVLLLRFDAMRKARSSGFEAQVQRRGVDAHRGGGGLTWTVVRYPSPRPVLRL